MCFFDCFLGQTANTRNGASTADRVAPKVAWLVATGLSLGTSALPAPVATVTRSVVVQGIPAEVWAFVGPFCAIRDWLPPVATCSEDGGVPPVRTLVTKDGSATFVEQQTARSETAYFYSYVFLSSPLPVKDYSSTVSVAAFHENQSVVTWQGTYTPDSGMEQDAETALNGIYAAGLDSIQKLAEQRFLSQISLGEKP